MDVIFVNRSWGEAVSEMKFLKSALTPKKTQSTVIIKIIVLWEQSLFRSEKKMDTTLLEMASYLTLMHVVHIVTKTDM
jgi:hypothetical protein